MLLILLAAMYAGLRILPAGDPAGDEMNGSAVFGEI